MRYKTDEIRKPITIDLQGDEEWLRDIYLTFGQKKPGEGPRITGRLTLTPADYGTFYFKGDISYAPFVACGRCDDLIPWEVKRGFDVRFLTPYVGEDEEASVVEKDLSPEDLDDYYIENNEVNLEPVLNDIIQTSFPTQLVKKTADGKACAICLENVEMPVVYEQQSAEEASPFAALKKLKLPE